MKKIAIIVVDSTCFDNVAISLKNNEERINWLSDVDADIRIEERDSIVVFNRLSEFINEYNCGVCHSADNFLVEIKYDSNVGIMEYIRGLRDAKAINEAEDEAACLEAIEHANSELEECIALLHNCNNLQEVYELIDGGTTGMYFGSGNYSTTDYIGVCYGSIQFDVLAQCDGGIMIAGDRVQVFREGVEIYCGYINEEGVNGVESQDSSNIYLKPDEQEVKSVGVDIDDLYPLDEDGEHVFRINCDYWLHIMVQSDCDCFAWSLYDKDFNLIYRNYWFGLDKDTWHVLLYGMRGIEANIGDVILSFTYIAPSIFKFLKNA